MKCLQTMVLRLGTSEKGEIPLSLALQCSVHITVGNETGVKIFGRNVSSV
jgi:hypothetical protein